MAHDEDDIDEEMDDPDTRMPSRSFGSLSKEKALVQIGNSYLLSARLLDSQITADNEFEEDPVPGAPSEISKQSEISHKNPATTATTVQNPSVKLSEVPQTVPPALAPPTLAPSVASAPAPAPTANSASAPAATIPASSQATSAPVVAAHTTTEKSDMDLS